MRQLLFTIVFVLLATSVSATVLVDGSSGKKLTTGIAHVKIDGSVSDIFITPQQPLMLPPTSTKGGIVLFGWKNETYAYYAQLSPGKIPLTIILTQSGLLLGAIRDTKENFLVNASLILSCTKSEERLNSDETGHFRSFVPVGSCTVSATKHGLIGSVETNITQGAVSKVNIILKKAERDATPSWPLFATMLIGMIAVFVILAQQFKREQASRTIKQSVKQSYLAEQHREALKEKEQLIVDELLLHKGTMRLSELRSATHIPRTSLLRTLEGLEQRGLVLKKEENRHRFVELVNK